ncbi:MAG: hypothetical protein ACRD3B_16155 [Candidatus Sulfotelmatobacter sp.]
MSRTSRKFVIAYIVLVGIPLAGLAFVLKAGNHLAAPYAVDGSWKFEVPDAPLASACSSFLSISGAAVSVSQSGKLLVISLNGKTATGTLDGKSLRAQFVGTDDAPGCSDHALTLAATLETGTEPRSMAGSLSFSNCASCSVDFRAVRQPRAPGGGSH